MKTSHSILICFALLFSFNGFAQDVIIQGANFGVALPGSDEPATEIFIPAEEPREVKIEKIVIATDTVIRPEEFPEEQYLKVIDATTDNDEVYIKVDRVPHFPGGEEHLWRHINGNMRYPEGVASGVQGQVHVKFIVRRSGEITDVQVARSLHPLLDEEALRLVNNMPKWVPADYHGRAVSSPREMFIFFKVK